MHGRDEKCIQKLVGKPEGTKPLESPGLYEKIIFMDLKERRCGLDPTGSG
jgi:hypothetical protein